MYTGKDKDRAGVAPGMPPPPPPPREFAVLWARTRGTILLAVLLLLWLVGGDKFPRLALMVVIPFIYFTVFFPYLRPRWTTQRSYYGGIATLALLALITVIAVSAHFSSWCCIRNQDLDRMCSKSLEVIELFKANNIPTWICFGSLLAAVREKDQPLQLIPWEHDFDLCVLRKDFPRVTKLLQSMPADQWHLEDTVYRDYSLRARLSRTYIDIYRFDEEGDQLSTADGFHDGPKYFPRDSIFPLGTAKICDAQVPAPRDPTVMLETIFSKGYMTPRWPEFPQKQTCQLYTDCKLHERPTQ